MTSRLLGGWVLGLVALVLVVAVSVAIGTKQIPLGGVIEALRHYDPDITDHAIVGTVRIPRTVLAVIVGIALGLSGAVMQGLTRNPLADPGILGVEAGAALAVVIAIYALGVVNPIGYVWFAFLGAGVVSVVVYALGALGRGGATPVKLALAGAAMTSFLGSITAAILIRNVDTLSHFRFWAVGSVADRGLDVAWQVLPFALAGMLLALSAGPGLNTIALGDEVARSLGQRQALARVHSAVVVVLLTGAATAAAGPVGFVGLTVPHLARRFTGPDHRWILAYSAVFGPILLVGADVVGRVLVRPAELQVGIVTALIGAPFFVLLVRRRRVAEL